MSDCAPVPSCVPASERGARTPRSNDTRVPGSWRRPALLPGLTRIQHADGSLQLGLEPPVARVVTGLGPRAVDLVDALDGTRGWGDLHTVGAAAGVAPHDVDELLTSLGDSGLLVEAGSSPALTGGLHEDERARLEPDLVSVGLRVGGIDRVKAWRRRRAAWVDVRGAGRVGSTVAVLLAGAGVGRVTVRDPEPARLADASPAGFLRAPADVPGSDEAQTWDSRPTTREEATRQRIASLAPSVRTARAGTSTRPALTVLAPALGPDPALAATWSRRNWPHVLAYVQENRAVAGPLVVPGESCCLFCLGLHQRDGHPQWPLTTARSRVAGGSAACDLTLVTLVAAQIAMQALCFLEAGTSSLINTTLETTFGSGLTRRHSWPPHPGCSCRWSAQVVPAGKPPSDGHRQPAGDAPGQEPTAER